MKDSIYAEKLMDILSLNAQLPIGFEPNRFSRVLYPQPWRKRKQDSVFFGNSLDDDIARN